MDIPQSVILVYLMSRSPMLVFINHQNEKIKQRTLGDPERIANIRSGREKQWKKGTISQYHFVVIIY